MHPAYSVILFSTASGAGYGLLALLGLVGAAHGPASSLWFATTAMAVALSLIVFGLVSSTFHLGRPERSWRSFSQWRSSWLSREGIAALACFAPALGFGLAWTGLIHAPAMTGIAGLLTAILCAATVFCTGKIYSTLQTVRAWHQPLTVPVYFAFSLATGATLLMVLAAGFGRYQIFQMVLSVAALLVLIVLKLLYWRAIDSEARSHSIEAATGLGRAAGDVRQWEVPHTATNFIMKEMGYAVARKHAFRLRLLVLGLLGLAIAVALPTALAPVAFGVIAASATLIASVIERWLFFAEAQHVVTLFYGASAA